MSSAVVRCPACRGASRVPAGVIGQMVGCPRCGSPFVAEVDAPVAPLPSRARPPRTDERRPAPERPAAVIPIAPPRWRVPPREEPGESEPLPAEAPDPEHDPHTRPVGGLPVSVLVGFALMPFGIPLLWFVGPLVSGKEAALSLAVPAALAIAAAALCLGVVYTIDWTAATRIKGVLILVGLAYLTAAGLYFLKKDLMDRVQHLFGKPDGWGWVRSREGNFHVRMPGNAGDWKPEERPIAAVELVGGRHSTLQLDNGSEYKYFAAGSKRGSVPDDPDPVWFKAVEDDLTRAAGVKPASITLLALNDHNRHQWEFKLNGGAVRVVQVFAVKGRAYYLSAEGPDLAFDDEQLGKPFFGSFATIQQK